MFKFYEVGGRVRDELLGLESKDIDYVAVPEVIPSGSDISQMFARLQSYLVSLGFSIFLATPRCFTIRAKFPKGHKHEGIADFVLARKELSYKEGTREPVVVPGTLLDDLTRRDFTINAIAKDEDGMLYDPFGGQIDLKRRHLRTPIHGDITFADDPLRLLRAIRFSVTKDMIIGHDIHQILHTFNYNEKFSVVSEERIREELAKCFRFNTWITLFRLQEYVALSSYIFNRTNLWLKPTNENKNGK